MRSCGASSAMCAKTATTRCVSTTRSSMARRPTSFRVTAEETRAAYDEVDGEIVDALKFAADRIRRYHEQQLRGSLMDFNQNGLGQMTRAIQRIGVYVPGTRAPLPSTVLMCAVPARVAGVDELFMTSPILPDGSVPPVKLVAADIAGVDGVFKAGGSQGVAAFAYGTETFPRVDKICGPGGLFVTIAKKQVFGDVGIDSIYGPTETVVIADESADPEMVARGPARPGRTRRAREPDPA